MKDELQIRQAVTPGWWIESALLVFKSEKYHT